jgi:hypothetical protein
MFGPDMHAHLAYGLPRERTEVCFIRKSGLGSQELAEKPLAGMKLHIGGGMGGGGGGALAFGGGDIFLSIGQQMCT